MNRFDLNFDENRKIAYFIASDVSGGVLPSEKDLLPAHLRGKSLAELAKHTLLLFNQMWLPEAREELIAIHTPEMSVSTSSRITTCSNEEFIARREVKYKDYDPSRGTLYATNEDGSLRADVEEVVKGKTVRVAVVAGAEQIR